MKRVDESFNVSISIKKKKSLWCISLDYASEN